MKMKRIEIETKGIIFFVTGSVSLSRKSFDLTVINILLVLLLGVGIYTYLTFPRFHMYFHCLLSSLRDLFFVVFIFPDLVMGKNLFQRVDVYFTSNEQK